MEGVSGLMAHNLRLPCGMVHKALQHYQARVLHLFSCGELRDFLFLCILPYCPPIGKPFVHHRRGGCSFWNVRRSGRIQIPSMCIKKYPLDVDLGVTGATEFFS